MESKEIQDIANEYAKLIAKDKRVSCAGDALLVGTMVRFQLERALAETLRDEQSDGLMIVNMDGPGVTVS